MSIFQKSVIKKHLSNLDKEQVEKAFQKFQSNYNPSKIEKVKELKEEEYQDGFLRDIFVDVLGYTLKPDDNYDLEREFKNKTDSGKADGAIVKEENAIGVIELKSTKTKDLTFVTQQAFDYKNNQPECKYIITSNFQKLRFYIDYATEFEEFDLFNLNREEFDLLYLILSKESIFSNLPLKLKEETQFHEQNVSENLYKDYSNFKRKLFDNLTTNHPEIDKLLLFKKTQKLLDRFLFILFAEDSGLLPPNSISRIIKRFEILKGEDAYKPLYEILKQYFGYMNLGRKGKKDEDDIPEYNGGLFYQDALLDNLKIDDEILKSELKNLSKFDFNTEVDVNILGHIFEHSLSEIEEVSAEIEGITKDKSRSKRKKDGVFYTPKYITQYIVENTVGTLCKEKRAELEIEEIEFDGSFRTKDGSLSVKGQNLFKKLTDYKEWLLKLKIVDPACGSGAFLNQALNFLIAEHKNSDDIIAELTNTPLRLYDVDKNILENNLFGVDINEESIEIAKLSLWLRTAQKGRKLSGLNNNIKCGNSLINDPEIAGEKAFDWNEEFKDIMQKGGFDVVIGNPPWNSKISLSESVEIAKQYNLDLKNLNIFAVFFYLGNKIISNVGIISLLVPEVIIKNSSYFTLRKLIINKYNFISITDYGKFPGVASNTVSVCYKMNNPNGKTIVNIFKNNRSLSKSIDTNIYNENPIKAFSFDIDNEKQKIINKISKKISLDQIARIKRGIELGQVTELVKCSNCNKHSEITTKYYSSRDSNKCKYCNSDINLKYKFSFSSREQNHLYKIPCLSGREVNRYIVNNYYYIIPNLNGIDYKNEIFSTKNLFVKRIATKPEATLIHSTSYTFNTLYSIHDLKIYSKEYLLLILNSKLINYYYELVFNLGMNLTTQITIEYLKKTPIPRTDNQEPFIEKANKMLELNKQLQEKSKSFIKRINDNFKIEKVSKKLETFYENDFKTFIKELSKQKVKLSLTQQDGWEKYFTTYKTEINEIQYQINTTDKQIDKMVYALYELTDKEIEIVKKSVS